MCGRCHPFLVALFYFIFLNRCFVFESRSSRARSSSRARIDALFILFGKMCESAAHQRRTGRSVTMTTTCRHKHWRCSVRGNRGNRGNGRRPADSSPLVCFCGTRWFHVRKSFCQTGIFQKPSAERHSEMLFP